MKTKKPEPPGPKVGSQGRCTTMSVSIPSDLMARLVAYAQGERRTKSWLVCEALEMMLGGNG